MPEVKDDFPKNRARVGAEQWISRLAGSTHAFTCLALIANRTFLDYVIGVYLVKIILLLIGQGSRPCFPLAGQIC